MASETNVAPPPPPFHYKYHQTNQEPSSYANTVFFLLTKAVRCDFKRIRYGMEIDQQNTEATYV